MRQLTSPFTDTVSREDSHAQLSILFRFIMVWDPHSSCDAFHLILGFYFTVFKDEMHSVSPLIYIKRFMQTCDDV
jgi:hypothetical protein